MPEAQNRDGTAQGSQDTGEGAGRPPAWLDTHPGSGHPSYRIFHEVTTTAGNWAGYPLGQPYYTLVQTSSTSNQLTTGWTETSMVPTIPMMGDIPSLPSAEELRAYQQSVEAERQARAERARADAQAQERAEQLLCSLLSPAQLTDYQNPKKRYFDVQGSAGRHYRLYHWKQINIHQIDAKGLHTKARLCVEFKRYAPLGDLLIAELLLLQSDENKLRQIARIHYA